MAGVGVLLPLALVALVVAGFYLWARRQGHVAAATDGPGRHSSVSLLTEAVAYVGAVLVLGGGIAAVVQNWNDISDWGHVGLPAAVAALFLAAGLVLRNVADDAIRRLVSALWFVSVGGVAAAVALATHDVYGGSGTTTLLVTGLATTAYSTALWLLRRRALQNAALFVSLIVAVCGVIAASFESPTPSTFALSLWALGLAWAGLGWLRVAEPMWTSMPLGVVLALVAPSVGIADHGWMFAIAIATAGALMAASVPLHNTPLLGVATVAMFAYVTWVLVRYFTDSLGVPAALAIAGLLILGLAVVSARLLRAATPPTDEIREGDGKEERPRQMHH
jgi:hypothetical protein